VQDEFDAVELAIAGKASLAVTSTLVPYPGTAIYNYVMQHKLLDGPNSVADSKRPVVKLIMDQQFSSIQKRSILNCFTDKQKDVLLNISTVFPAMVALPWIRKLLYRLVFILPYNPLYVYLAILAKAYKTNKYIYPTKMPLTHKLYFLFKALKIEGGRMIGLEKKVA